MTDKPVPVIMLSALTTQGAETTLRALELGAVDFVAKPKGKKELAALARELPLKVRGAARVPPKQLVREKNIPVGAGTGKGKGRVGFVPEVVVIGISTGGPSALNHLLKQLPANLPLGIVVAQHMPPGFTLHLAKRLNNASKLAVKEAQKGDLIGPGQVFIGPAGYQTQIVRTGSGLTIEVFTREEELYHPSANILFESAVKACGGRVLALVMTGMGSDGSEGLKEVKAQGGYVLAEAEETCVVYGMPRAAVQAGVVDEVVPLHHLAARLKEIILPG